MFGVCYPRATRVFSVVMLNRLLPRGSGLAGGSSPPTFGFVIFHKYSILTVVSLLLRYISTSLKEAQFYAFIAC